MGFDLGSAVSFGLGDLNAQDQMHQIAFQRQQEQQQLQQGQMALMMNGLKLKDEQQNFGYSQEEAKYAKQLATDPDTMDLPMDQKMDLMAKNALSTGDLVRANELATNVANFRQSQINQDYKRQQAAEKQMEGQQKLHSYMGSELAAAADEGEDAFNQAKMIALQSGQGTPQDQKMLASLQWDPDLARRLRMGSMTSRQQAQTLAEQQRIELDRINKERLERNRQINQQIHQQRLKDQEDQAAIKNKAGGGAKAPTKVEMEQAEAIVTKMGVDPKSPEFTQLQQSVVSTAKQIQKANPNIGTAQAMQQAANKIGKQDLRNITVPAGMFTGEQKKVEYKMAGATSNDPIPYTGDPSSLIPGRYYKTGSHGVMQFTGTGFVPVH